MVFLMLLSLLSVRLLLQQLGVEDYGLYNAVGGVVLSMSFISSVLSSASQRYFSFELGRHNNQALNKIFGTLFITYIGLSAIIIVVSLTIGEWFVLNKMSYSEVQTTTVQWVFLFSVASFVISMIMTPFQALVISYEDMNY